MGQTKFHCEICREDTIRATETILGILCEKCIIKIRGRLSCSLSVIKVEGIKRRENRGKKDVPSDNSKS